jgi:Short C-terminal domain
MLFLYRPRQTWMPYSLPRNRTEQAQYNRRLQERFASTRRVAPAVPAARERDPLADLEELGELHRSGVLTDAEFEAAKAKLLAT